MEQQKYPTNPFNIYEFSKMFDFVRQNGRWVSGGYKTNQNEKFGRSNFPNQEIPQEILDADKKDLFEIPNGYPPINVGDVEFKQMIENNEYNLARPALKYIALIARELSEYCVLAVATRQVDDGWRKVMGYRYFFLKKSEVVTSGNKEEEKLDGIATLLEWWKNNNYPCFNMDPNVYENSPTKNTPAKADEYYNYPQSPNLSISWNPSIVQSKSMLLFLTEDNSIAQLIGRPIFHNSLVSINEIRCTPSANMNQAIIDGKLNYWQVHYLSAQQNKGGKMAWAWNVYRITKPESFSVIYCADSASCEAIARQISDGQSLETVRNDTSANARTNQTSSTATKTSAMVSAPSTGDHLANRRTYLEEVSEYPDSAFLNELAEDYYKYRKIEDWRNILSREIIEKRQLLSTPQLEPPRIYINEVKYLTLVDVLFPTDTNSILSLVRSNRLDISRYHKQLMIDYLDDELLKALEHRHPENSQQQESFNELAENAENLKQELTSQAKDGDGGPNILEQICSSIENFVNLTILKKDLAIKKSFEMVAKYPRSHHLDNLLKCYQNYPPSSAKYQKYWQKSKDQIAQKLNESANLTQINWLITQSLALSDVLFNSSNLDDAKLKNLAQTHPFDEKIKKSVINYLNGLITNFDDPRKSGNQETVKKLTERINTLKTIDEIKVSGSEQLNYSGDFYLMITDWLDFAKQYAIQYAIPLLIVIVLLSLPIIPWWLSGQKSYINFLKENQWLSNLLPIPIIKDYPISWPEVSEKTLPKSTSTNNDKDLIKILGNGLKIAGAKKIGGGTYDKNFKEAVQYLQKEKCGLTDTGEVDQKTWDCLLREVEFEKVSAILDYQIKPMSQCQTDQAIWELGSGLCHLIIYNGAKDYIKECQNKYDDKPKDFIKCLYPSRFPGSGPKKPPSGKENGGD